MKRYILLLIGFLSHLVVGAQLNTDQVMRMGRNALYYDDYVLSIHYFNLVINARPSLYEPYYFRGLAKFYLEDYAGAVQDCSSAIERNAYILDFYRLRGLCHIKNGAMPQAVDDYTRALGLNANDQMAWYNRTLCRLQMKDYTQASLDLDTMMSKWKDYTKSYEIKAQLLLETKDTLRADSMLDVVLRLQPQNASSWGLKGLVALRGGRYVEADSFLTQAIKYQKSETTYYLNRALANYYLRRLRKSMDDYDQALSLEPDNFFGHYNRGLLRTQVGEDNKAIEDFTFVINREPNNMPAVFNRGLLYEQTGNYRGAISDYSRVIRQHPKFWTGIANRARCYRKIGNMAAALRDERKLTIAQLEQVFGSPRTARRTMRKRKEQNIEDYKDLVIDDSDDSTSYEKYESEIRGRIQNRKVEERPLPMFEFGLQRAGTVSPLSKYSFLPLLEAWNRCSDIPALRLQLQNATTGSIETDKYQHAFTELEKLEVALRNEKDESDYLRAGFLYSVVKDYASAKPMFDKAIEQGGEFVALAYWQRAVVQMKLLSVEVASNEDAQRKSMADVACRSVLDDLNKAQAGLPPNAFLAYNKGNVYMAMKRYDDAVRAYGDALKADAALADAYYNRGLAHLLQENIQEGLADLSKAGELGIYQAYALMKQYRAKTPRSAR